MARITVGRVLSFLTDSVISVLKAGSKGTTASAEVTSTSVDADHQALDVVVQRDERSSSAERTSVVASATDVLLLEANTARRGATFYNDADAALMLGLGTDPVNAGSFTVLIASQTLWTLEDADGNFTGEIRGAWEAASPGAVRVTELT